MNDPLNLLKPLIYKTHMQIDMDERIKLSRTLFGQLMALSDSPGKYVNHKYQNLVANPYQLVEIASFMTLSGNYEEVMAIVERNKHQFLHNGSTLDNMYMTFLLGLPVAKVLAPLMLLLLLFAPFSRKKVVMLYTLCVINRIIYMPSKRTLEFLQGTLYV